MTVLPPPSARDRVDWRTRLRAACTERLGLKATSLLLAVLLWIVLKVVVVRTP
jgi:hypothetical protein